MTDVEFERATVLEMIDLSRVRPMLTCVGFQQSKVQKLGKKYTQDGLEFEDIVGSGMAIVELPAPAGAPSWVPKSVRYLHVEGYAKLHMTLPKGARWLEVSVAAVPETGAPNPGKSGTVDVRVLNAKGWVSAPQRTPWGEPYGTVRTYVFSAGENVTPPRGEFQPIPDPEPLGPITEASIIGGPGLLLWQVCYW